MGCGGTMKVETCKIKEEQKMTYEALVSKLKEEYESMDASAVVLCQDLVQNKMRGSAS